MTTNNEKEKEKSVKSLKDFVTEKPHMKHLNVKISEELFEKVRKAAEKLNIKTKQYVEAALKKALEEK